MAHRCHYLGIFRAVGDEIEIGSIAMMITAHAAIRLAQAAESTLQPFRRADSPESIEALVEVASKVIVPLAAGERLYNKWSVLELIKSGAIALVQPETTRLGGITELKKVSALAEASGIHIAPHDGSVGPIVEMANAHVMATTPAFLYLEHKDDDVPWRYEVVRCAAEVKGGQIPVVDAPGLGIELDLEEIERHPAAGIGELRCKVTTPGQVQRWR